MLTNLTNKNLITPYISYEKHKTGDVLSGILACFASQISNLNDVALLGAYFHAECAQQYNKHYRSNSLTSTKLIDMIPYAYTSIKNVY